MDDIKRKVVKQGASTMTISLPSSWVNKFRISGGDEVCVEEKGNLLIIKSDSPKAVDSRTIDITKLHPLVNRVLIGIFKEGRDEVKVVVGDPSQLQSLRKVVSELICFEIVEEGKNYCLIKDVAGSSAHEFDNVYRRIYFLLKGIGEESYNAVKDGQFGLMPNLILKDVEVNKFCYLCQRLLNKKDYKEPNKTKVVYSIAQRLESIGDEYKFMLGTIMDDKIKLEGWVLDIYRKINELFSMCHDFAFTLKQEKAKEVAKFYDGVNLELKEAISKVKDVNQMKVLMHLNTLLLKIIYIQGAQLVFIKDL